MINGEILSWKKHIEFILPTVCLPAVGLLQIPAWFSTAFIFLWVVVHTEKLIEPSYPAPGNAHFVITLQYHHCESIKQFFLRSVIRNRIKTRTETTAYYHVESKSLAYLKERWVYKLTLLTNMIWRLKWPKSHVI